MATSFQEDQERARALGLAARARLWITSPWSYGLVEDTRRAADEVLGDEAKRLAESVGGEPALRLGFFRRA